MTDTLRPLAATVAGALLLGLAAAPSPVDAQSRVQYGRITAVTPVTVDASAGRPVGAIVGGAVGLASGRNQSSSNRALRALGGAAAGGAVGNMAGATQAFEYTVLVGGTNTVRVVSDQVGKRVGDCVSVEQGQFANIRLVADSRCAAPAARSGSGAAAPAANAGDVRAANACEQAKQQVLAAETDEAFASAERRMRLLCGA
jgi:outer membrane lipoprotein SlyB